MYHSSLENYLQPYWEMPLHLFLQALSTSYCLDCRNVWCRQMKRIFCRSVPNHDCWLMRVWLYVVVYRITKIHYWTWCQASSELVHTKNHLHFSKLIVCRHSSEGKSGLEVVLFIIDRLLRPDLSDQSALEVGGLAAELVDKVRHACFVAGDHTYM